MTQFARTIVELEGYDGAPGVNIFNWCGPAHADITQSYVNDFNETLSEAFDAVTAAGWADGVVVTINPNVGVHEVDTGDLVGGFIDEGGPYTWTGTGDGEESRATQLGFRWLTNDFRNGRRVQGRTFFGPAPSGVLDATGNVAAGIRSTLPPFFDGIIDGLGGRLIVWSRPTPGNTDGAYADVVSCTIAPKPFILRGRRD